MRSDRRNHRRGERLAAAAMPVALALLIVALVACGDGDTADAYGNFEATEVVVSAQTTGQVQRFLPVEGALLARGDTVALIDTTQLSLERAQATAQRSATAARRTEVAEQIKALEAQHEIALRGLERTRRLHAGQAATQQQLDQAEREYRVLDAQLGAARAARTGAGQEFVSSEARLAQLEDRVSRSLVTNPKAGTVLATYARAGEMVQLGQPLYRVAALDTLELRAYVSGEQLAGIRIGQPVTVHVSGTDGAPRAFAGRVSWVASKAEFTPTPVQTRDERSELVYAIKVVVPNADGALKIGMPADVTFGVPSGVPSGDGAATP
jgi:HlyD family secretion protein